MSKTTFSVPCVACALVFLTVGVVIRATGPSWPDESEERQLKEQLNELNRKLNSQNAAMAEQHEKTGSVAPEEQQRLDALQREKLPLDARREKIEKTKMQVLKNRERADYWGFGPAVFFVVVLVVGNVMLWSRSNRSSTPTN